MTAGVSAEMPHRNDRHRRALQRGLHAIFAVDGVRALKQFSRRLFAQHIFPVRRADQEGRVGLPALELLHLRGLVKIFKVSAQIFPEPRFIEAVAWEDVNKFRFCHDGSPYWRINGGSAIGKDHLAGDVAGCIRRKKHGDACDIARLA